MELKKQTKILIGLVLLALLSFSFISLYSGKKWKVTQITNSFGEFTGKIFLMQESYSPKGIGKIIKNENTIIFVLEQNELSPEFNFNSIYENTYPLHVSVKIGNTVLDPETHQQENSSQIAFIIDNNTKELIENNEYIKINISNSSDKCLYVFNTKGLDFSKLN